MASGTPRVRAPTSAPPADQGSAKQEDSLRDATADQVADSPRARHVVGENARVLDAARALRRGDVDALGPLMAQSHASLRDDYEVSTPAVEAAVQRLKEAGALGARIVGGGFGGHVLGLLAPDARPPDGAVEVHPGAGARVLEQH